MPSTTQEKHIPNYTFQKEVKKLYGGPVTLILFFAGLLYLASLVLSFVMEETELFLPLGTLIKGFQAENNTPMVVLAIFTLVATATNFIGFTIVRFCTASGNPNMGSTVGCYFMKVTKLAHHIAIFFATLMVVIPVIVAINDAYEFAHEWEDVLEYWGYIALVVTVGVAVLFFHLLNTISVSVMKEVLTQKSPISGTHILSAIGHFLLASVVIGYQCYTSFNLTLCMAVIYCILWGVYTLRFRSAMNAIAETE